ncbi:MAG: sulfatase [bacterium]
MLKIIFTAVWGMLFFASMNYIGAQWEYEGLLTTGLLVGISFVSTKHILYSIATVLASAFIASAGVLFLAMLFRSNRTQSDKRWLAVAVVAIALITTAFVWNRRTIRLSLLPASYRYYDSTGKLLEPDKYLQNAPKINVILISIDTLNPLHLGVHGNERNTSPTIDSLANEGVFFRNAFSHSPKTSPSHMSLFTSLYPSVHKIRNWNRIQGGYSLDHRLITLPEILKNAGFQTAAFTGGGNVQSSIGFGDGFDTYHNEDQVWENAFSWLDANYDTKFFLFLHTFKVHSPYLPPAPYNTMFSNDYDGKIIDSEKGLHEYFKKSYPDGAPFPGSHDLFWEQVDKKDPRDVEHLVALYDGLIRFMNDKMMATLLNRLRKYHLTEKTLLIFTSDHGEEFLEHGDFLHKELYDEHIHVPLIMHFPGEERFKNRVIEQQASLIDVAPTILNYLSLPIPVMMQGTNLLTILDGKDLDLPVFSERIVISDALDKKKSVRTKEWKYIWWPTKKKAELFDVLSDPGELHNIAEQRPDVSAKLHRQVTDWMRENEEKGQTIKTFTHTFDTETIEKLESLGYGAGKKK